jgi:hypothetical protein
MDFFNNKFAYLRELYTARHDPENARVLAEFYWHLILVAAFATVTLIIAGGIWQFVRVIDVLHMQPTTTVRPNVLDRAKLRATLSAWEARTQEFQALKGTPPNVADPSR